MNSLKLRLQRLPRVDYENYPLPYYVGSDEESDAAKKKFICIINPCTIRKPTRTQKIPTTKRKCIKYNESSLSIILIITVERTTSWKVK